MQDPSTTGYYLHVDLVVAEENTEKFESTVTEFLNTGGFDRIVEAGDPGAKGPDTKRLVFALKAQAPFAYAPAISLPSITAAAAAPPQAARRYVHLWRTPLLRDLDLLRLMRLCAADSLYQKLDALVLEEAQDFVARIRTPLPTQASRPLFVRSIRRFPSFSLGTYLFKIGALTPALEAKGFVPLGRFQSVTGTLNSLVEFWNTDADDGSSLARLLGGSEQPGFIQAFVEPCDPPSPTDPARLPIAEHREVLTPYLKLAELTKAGEAGQLDELVGVLSAGTNEDKMAAQ